MSFHRFLSNLTEKLTRGVEGGGVFHFATF
jgi:hypothetical protein